MLPIPLLAWRVWHHARYRLRRRTRHHVHSPRVYALADQVLPHRRSADGDRVERWRRALHQSHDRIRIEDYGAGYGGDGKRIREVRLRDVVRRSARSPRSGELLRRLVQHHQPANILELGTNLGIGTAYLAAAAPAGARLVSVEGAAQLVALAQQTLSHLQLSAQLVHAAFADFLTQPPLAAWDFVLLDGHHDGAATLRYVKLLLPQMAPGGLLVLDDIDWSPDMYRAWQALVCHPQLPVTVELGNLGLAYTGVAQAAQHFCL